MRAILDASVSIQGASGLISTIDKIWFPWSLHEARQGTSKKVLSKTFFLRIFTWTCWNPSSNVLPLSRQALTCHYHVVQSIVSQLFVERYPNYLRNKIFLYFFPLNLFPIMSKPSSSSSSSSPTPLVQRWCSGIGCKKPVEKLKCPECVKLKLVESYFCSQDCFRQSWPIHSMLHRKSSPLECHPKRSSWSFLLKIIVTLLQKNQGPGCQLEEGVSEVFRGFTFSGSHRPYKVSAKRVVPDHIERPDYAATGN